MSETKESISERYKKWEKLLYKIAITTIGKTTVRVNKPPKSSEKLEQLRKERRECKRQLHAETSPTKKPEKLDAYVKKQIEIKECVIEEEGQRVNYRFTKMMEDRSKGRFCNALRMMKKDDTSSWLITKNPDGERIFDPDENKENIHGSNHVYFIKINF